MPLFLTISAVHVDLYFVEPRVPFVRPLNSDLPPPGQ